MYFIVFSLCIKCIANIQRTWTNWFLRCICKRPFILKNRSILRYFGHFYFLFHGYRIKLSRLLLYLIRLVFLFVFFLWDIAPNAICLAHCNMPMWPAWHKTPTETPFWVPCFWGVMCTRWWVLLLQRTCVLKREGSWSSHWPRGSYWGSLWLWCISLPSCSCLVLQ